MKFFLIKDTAKNLKKWSKGVPTREKLPAFLLADGE
jgi:hypothetical protein